MYLEHIVPSGVAALFSPRCFIKRLRYPELVSFGLLANLSVLSKRGAFAGVDGLVDVGANIGQFAFMFHAVAPGLPIFSFEPDPTCFAALQRTFATHGIGGRCFPLAVGDKSGNVELNVYGSTANNSLLHRQNERVERVERVQCATLDDLQTSFPSLRAPFLKIDVQGAELAVLRGATRLLERCKCVQLEVSLVSSYEGNAHVADIFAVMRTAGFSCWEILDVLRKRRPNDLGIVEMDLLFVRGEAVR